MLLLGGATRSLALSLSANGNEFGHSTSPTAAAYGKRLKPSKTRVSTQRLHYRNEGSDEEHQKQQRWTMSTPLVTSGVVSAKGRKFLVRAPPSSTAEDDQDTQKVDEYLEFLDKRYNRVHQIDGSPQKKKSFSVLKWLGQEDHSEAPEDSNSSHSSNALYALGVAGLASERLLQKHGVAVRKCSVVQPETPENAITVEHAPCDPPAATTSKLAAMAAKLLSLHQRWTSMQATFVACLVREGKQVARLLWKTLPRKLASFVRVLVKAGGGQRNIMFAFSALCIFAVHFAQPLAKSAISSRSQV